VAERKPPGVSWESWIDRQIREGMERGEFDDLPGHGKPLRDLDRPRDEMWWVRDKLRREAVSYLPPTLAVRKELDDAWARIAAADSEATVREIVAAINARIVAVNSRVTAGPPSTLVPLDAEQVLEEWKATRTRRHPDS
jgi:DnaJ-like protein